MSSPRLVMASGTAPGAGKSTLVARLAEALRQKGDVVDVVTEDDVWGARRLDDDPISRTSARREFISLLHSGRPPTIKDLGVTFDDVASTMTGRWWLQDWTWQDLAATVPGQAPNVAAADAMATRLARHQAVVFYLLVDPVEAVLRAASQRGETWLRRHARGLGLPPDSTVEEVSRVYAHHEETRLARLSSGPREHVVLDGGRNSSAVVADAIDILLSNHS